VDERLDPVRASLAAGKYLKQLKGELGTWPLALTAYNTGPARLRSLMRKHHTRDVSKIVDADGRDSFGWASQNYYAKVSAVARVTQDTVIARVPHDDVAVRLNKRMKIAELAKCVDVDPAALVAANLALTDAITSGGKAVPKGYIALVRHPAAP
jgi:membrane-bound lytic murein transglycosylase D